MSLEESHYIQTALLWLIISYVAEPFFVRVAAGVLVVAYTILYFMAIFK